MYLAHRWLDRNLTRLELVFALILITICVGTFLEKSTALFESAESSLVNATTANMKSALQIQAVVLQSTGRRQELAAMDGMNPFDLMQGGPVDYDALAQNTMTPVIAHSASVTVPANYVGEVDSDDAPGIGPGKWYFNRNSRELVYVWRHRYLEALGVEGEARTRLRVLVEYDDADGDNVYNPAVDRFTAVRLLDLSAGSQS